ncbi:hypothetical protein GCM10017711_11020 [Paeniglutamicibacter sulfureus]
MYPPEQAYPTNRCGASGGVTGWPPNRTEPNRAEPNLADRCGAGGRGTRLGSTGPARPGDTDKFTDT